MFGAKTTTASAIRTRVHRPRRQQARRSGAGVPAPPDANTLLSTYDHCLRSRQYVNVVVAGKQPHPNFLTMEEAIAHCTRGLGIWEWAGNETIGGEDPDVVIAAAGDVPTLEALAAVDLLRQHLPELRVRFVNVVD